METLFVFVNLAAYRQSTNAAWDWIIKKKKKIKIALSLGYPSSLFLQQKM